MCVLAPMDGFGVPPTPPVALCAPTPVPVAGLSPLPPPVAPPETPLAPPAMV